MYHVNRVGNVGKCEAKISCPFGDLEEDHYRTVEEARSAYEASHGSPFAQPMTHEPRANWRVLDEKTEGSVYSTYRLALRSLRATGSKARAGAKRQEALGVAAERHSLPVSQVKSIVVLRQEKEGIEKPHDPRYLKEVKFQELGDDLLRSASRNEAGELVCACGSTEEVRVRALPVEFEIYGKLVPTLNCFPCYLNLKTEV